LRTGVRSRKGGSQRDNHKNAKTIHDASKFGRKSIPQGLKPHSLCKLMSDLKVRPPLPFDAWLP
jgi:hypothetical protein